MKYNHSLNITSVIVFTFILIVFGASNAFTQDLNTTKLPSEIVVGETIVWGYYEQDNDSSNGKEPIEWIVLKVDDDEALLISKYCLDCKKYNEEKVPTSWEKCSLRNWLNSDFFDEAFSQYEKSRIKSSCVSNEIIRGFDKGEDTEDKLFLLNTFEASDCLRENKYLKTDFTAYAKSRCSENTDDLSFFWLRSPGKNSEEARISEFIEKKFGCAEVDSGSYGIRPAMWLDINYIEGEIVETKESDKDITDFSQLVGKTITFGNYEQDNNEANGKEPIEWYILKVKGDKALLLSRNILYYKKYNDSNAGLIWEQCSLRRWLNTDFRRDAFGDTEQSRIVNSLLINANNKKYGTKGGDPTEDKIFLLSIDESEKLLIDSDFMVKAKNTSFANKVAIDECSGSWDEYSDYFDYWLRSPGENLNFASYISGGKRKNDFINYSGYFVNSGIFGIRPALWINIDSDFIRSCNPKKIRPNGFYKKIKPVLSLEDKMSDLSVRDIVTFGNYEQDNNETNGKEPLEWKVLKIEDDKALLVSKYCLDIRKYDEGESEHITWADCSLRKWLNSSFIDETFSKSERERLINAKIINDNRKGKIDSGKDTRDRVFLLSIEEVVELFENQEDRKAKATVYANSKKIKDNKKYSDYWLRTVGRNARAASTILFDGKFRFDGNNVHYLGTVRPAIWVNLNPDNSNYDSLCYNKAKQLISDKKYSEAKKILVELGDYKDSSELLKQLAFVGLKAGSSVYWGHYEQNNDESDGNEPIEWLVLGIKDNKALLISKYCLDCVKYNDDKTPITWSECSLRKWLNSTFYEEAFDDSEKVKIINQEINNSNNIEYETYGGDKTEDYVFVPSVSNIQRLWAITKSKNVKCTRYAQAKGAFIDSKGFCFYWLRSPGSNKNSAACIQNCELNLNGVSVDAKNWTVRPVIWVDLSK